jgi:hypothetical protein
MAVISKASGTQTATISTEHTLTTQTDAGSYVLVVDTANMALGDILELRIKTKVLSAGTTRLAYMVPYLHIQGEPNKYSVPVPIPASREIICTLKQTAGTGRAFPWEVLTL